MNKSTLECYNSAKRTTRSGPRVKVARDNMSEWVWQSLAGGTSTFSGSLHCKPADIHVTAIGGQK